MNPLLGITLVTASFAVVFGGLKVAKARLTLHPELSRKLVHMGMGLVTLSFPWLFAESWPVWVLSGSFVAALAAIRLVPALQVRFGKILGGVERQSWGEFYFPISVAIIFTFAHQQPAWYVIPLLVLTLADAWAALIGVRFGHLKYRTDEGSKSIEGSLAFFGVAALSTFIPGILLGEQSLARLAIAALCVGVLTAFIEAISWRGLDNLFLPLVTLVVLVRFEERETAELLVGLLVALGLFALILLWRHHTTLRDDALASTTLLLYVCWTLGGWLWLQPPLCVALVYTFLPFHPQRLPTDVHGNFVVLGLAAASLVWLFLDKGFHWADCRLPFVLSFSIQLAMVFFGRWRHCWPAVATLPILGAAAVVAWCLVFVPAVFLGLVPGAGRFAGLALGLNAGSVLAFWLLMGRPTEMPNSPGRWLVQTILALAGSSLGLLPLFSQCPT